MKKYPYKTPREENELKKQSIKIEEIKRLKELISFEQKRIKVCLVCMRKFASNEQLKTHEESSEMHKVNIEKRKSSNNIDSNPDENNTMN